MQYNSFYILHTDITFHTIIIFFSGIGLTNYNKTLQLEGLGYEKMAATYKCNVTSTGGQSSANGTLEVYCK